MIWKPNTTVAAIIEDQGRYLMVEEETEEGIRINQPAGHLEKNESLLDGVVREALEETAYDFIPAHLLGVYHWQHPIKDVTYLRFAFIGKIGQHHPNRALDQGIIRAVWMSYEDLLACKDIHRSPQVIECVNDYQAGQKYPLSVIHHL
jgi:8-oxo-dGTP pyrophosphatase MutT (NUDIX family)